VRNGVLGFYTVFQAPADLTQYLVTNGPAQAVIDGFQSANAQRHHSQRRVQLTGLLAGLGKPSRQQLAIGQIGGLIVIGDEVQTLGDALVLADIQVDIDIVGNLSLLVTYRADRHQCPVKFTILALIEQFTHPYLAATNGIPQILIIAGSGFSGAPDTSLVTNQLILPVAGHLGKLRIDVLDDAMSIGNQHGRHTLLDSRVQFMQLASLHGTARTIGEQLLAHTLEGLAQPAHLIVLQCRQGVIQLTAGNLVGSQGQALQGLQDTLAQ